MIGFKGGHERQASSKQVCSIARIIMPPFSIDMSFTADPRSLRAWFSPVHNRGTGERASSGDIPSPFMKHNCVHVKRQHSCTHLESLRTS